MQTVRPDTTPVEDAEDERGAFIIVALLVVAGVALLATVVFISEFRWAASPQDIEGHPDLNDTGVRDTLKFTAAVALIGWIVFAFGARYIWRVVRIGRSRGFSMESQTEHNLDAPIDTHTRNAHNITPVK